MSANGVTAQVVLRTILADPPKQLDLSKQHGVTERGHRPSRTMKDLHHGPLCTSDLFPLVQLVHVVDSIG